MSANMTLNIVRTFLIIITFALLTGRHTGKEAWLLQLYHPGTFTSFLEEESLPESPGSLSGKGFGSREWGGKKAHK